MRFGGKLMKKKVLILLVVAVLALAPAAAAQYKGASEEDSVGIGLNLGTNTGLGLKFGMGDFDIFANIGFDALHVSSNGFSLGGDVGVAYEVYDVDFGGGHHMPITVGLWVPMGFFIGDNFAFNLAALVHAGVEYQIPDVPVLFYLRLGLGVDMGIVPEFKLGFGFAGALGVMYVF